jgi:DNA-directed RNA polymerase subunit E'/Rpb7
METINIKHRMVLPCSGLHRELKRVLLEQLTEDVVGKCVQEYGHIVHVVRIHKILHYEISRVDSSLIFVIEYVARVLNPRIGMVSRGEICMVYPEGLFVNIQGYQKVLIPSQTLAEVSVDTFEVGDMIDVELTAVKYTGNYFNCIGRLKDL